MLDFTKRGLLLIRRLNMLSSAAQSPPLPRSLSHEGRGKLKPHYLARRARVDGVHGGAVGDEKCGKLLHDGSQFAPRFATCGSHPCIRGKEQHSPFKDKVRF